MNSIIITPASAEEAIEFSFPCANPDKLVNQLRDMARLRNDAQLCRALGVQPPMISKIRNGKSAISAGLVLRIHEVFGLPVAQLRQMLADQ